MARDLATRRRIRFWRVPRARASLCDGRDGRGVGRVGSQLCVHNRCSYHQELVDRVSRHEHCGEQVFGAELTPRPRHYAGVYVALVLVGLALEITQTVAPVTIARAALAVSAASLLAVILPRVANSRTRSPNAKVWVWVGVHSNDEALVFAPDIFVLVLSSCSKYTAGCGPQSGLRSALSPALLAKPFCRVDPRRCNCTRFSLVNDLLLCSLLVGLSLYAQKAQWDWGQMALRNALPVICGLHLFSRSIVDVFAEIDAVNCDEQTRSFGVCLGNLDFQSIASDLALVGLYFTALTFLVHTRRGSIRESSFLPSESEYRALTDPDEKRAFQKRRGSDRRGSDRTDPAAAARLEKWR